MQMLSMISWKTSSDSWAAALRDLARQPDRPGSLARPELGAGVRSWHLRLSREHVTPGAGIVR
jgi:toxin ParE1/3/4